MKFNYLVGITIALELVSCGVRETSTISTVSPTKNLPPPLSDADCFQSEPQLDPATDYLGHFKAKSNQWITKAAGPHHRGRDVFVRTNEPLWAIGRFTYGPLDQPLQGEKVSVYLSITCNGVWQRVGESKTTTHDHPHESVYGVKDNGGRIYFDLSTALSQPIPEGRHKVTFVVAGDHSTVSAYLRVVGPDTKIVVSDVDGTLTSSEYAAVQQIVTGALPHAHPGAAQLMHKLKAQGYEIYYLTARPEWMVEDTRKWLSVRNFPLGIINTTQSFLGANGTQAESFKVGELQGLKLLTGIVPMFAFGNKSSDVAAFGQSGIAAKNSYYYQLAGDALGGTIHSDYTKLQTTIPYALTSFVEP
jgi:hypothetical protein